MKTEYKVIVLSILLGLFLWVVGAALDYFIYYQGTFWGLLIYEIPPHEIYVRTLVLGCCLIFGVAISTVFGKFRRAEEKRRESEKQLRLAVKNSRDVLYKLNLRTGDFDYASPSVVELGGYTPQEFILLSVKGVLRRIHPEDRHRFMMHFRNVLRQAVEDGLAPTIEYRWKHHDGEYRWLSDNRTVIRDGDGNPVSLIGSVRDVTVQKEAEKALGESEKKYRTLIETAQEGIGITSLGEELVFVNKAFASILGYEPSELVGRNLREFVTEERFEAFQMETGKRQWGTSGRYETEMRHRDGSHRSLLVSASPLYDREGNYNGTLGMVVDITERKRAEEELQESEERYRAIWENSPTGICLTDRDGVYHYVNPAYCRTYGYSAEQLIGRRYYELIVHPQDREERFRSYKERFDAGKPIPLAEVELVRGDGEPVWIQFTGDFVRQNHSLKYLVSMNVDITERKKAEEALRKAHDELEIRVEERTAELVRANEDLLAEIAERKRVEDALRLQSEIVANMAEGVQLTRASDGVIVYTNPRFEDMFGYGHGELIGKNVSVLNAPSDKSPEDAAAEIIKSLSEEGVWYGEIQNIKKDGTHFWCRASVSTLEHRQHGEVWVAVHEDITTRKRAEQELEKHRDHLEELVGERMADLTRTNERLEQQIAERKRAEEALKESEEKFRAVVENAPNVILNVDREGTIQFINRTRLGTGVEEAIGKKIYQYVLPEYHTVVRETIDGVFESGKPGRYEIRGSGLEGGILWYDTQVGAIKQNGKVVAVTLITTDITERKRAEQALQESEEKYRLVSENIPVAVYSALPDEHSTTTLISGRILELTGYSHQEFVEHAELWTQIIHPDDREYVWKKIEEHREKMAPLDVEYRITTKDNTVKWIRDKATPMLDENGQIVRIDGFMEDITERKRAEEALAKSEAFLNATGRMAKVGGWEVDARTLEVRWTDETYRIHEVPVEHKPPLDEAINFFHPEDRPKLEQAIQRALEHGEPYDMEIRFITATGKHLWTHTICTPQVEDGKTVKLTGTFQDITERKRAEEALWKSEEKYRLVSENIPVAVYSALPDEHSTTTLISGRILELTGYSHQEFVEHAQLWAQIIHPDDREYVWKKIEEHREKMAPLDVEYRITTKDNTVKWIRDRATPMVDENGQLIRINGFMEDIAERKRAEEALRASRDYLEKLTNSMWDAVLSVRMPERVIEWANDSFRLIGYEPEECIGRTTEFLYPDKSEYLDFGNKLKSVIAAGKNILRAEQSLKRKNGELFPAEIVTTIFREKGEVVRVTSIVRDITERKQAEEALRETRDYLDNLIEYANAPIIVWNAEFTITRFNRAFEHLTGYSAEEVVGQHLRTLFPEDSREKSLRNIERTSSGEYWESVEIPILRRDGEIRVALWNSANIYAEDGKTLLATIAQGHDITERKRAEEALKESEEKFRAVVENAPNVILNVDREGTIQFINQTPPDRTVEEVIGTKIYDYILPEYHTVVRETIDRVFQSGEPGRYEIRGLGLEGEILWYDTQVGAIKQDGKVVAVTLIATDITERKKAEEALQESEAKWRSITENSPDHIMLLDREANIQFFNQTVPDLTKEQVIGTPIYNYVPEDYRPVMKESFERVMNTGQPDQYEVEYKSADGSTQVYETSVGPVLRGDEVVALTLSSRDITERKKAEEALRESEEKYRSFVRNFHGIAFRGDMEFLPQFFHGAVEEITGYTENEFIAGKPSWEKVIHPEDIPKIHESAVKLSSIPDYSADREYRIIRKDGQIRWVHELIQNICDDSGKPTLVQGALYDITERKKAEEAIRRSEEQLRALFDSAADTVFTKDLEGHYTRVNAACAKLHGLCEKEFIGKTDFDLFPEEHAQHFRDLDRHVIKEGRTFTGEYERPIGGKLHTFSVVKTPLYGPQGSIIGLCGIARDVTEQRSLEEQFRQAQKMESLGTLAGGVAHDFNNLLGGILGYVGLMKGDYSPGEKHYAMLELVEKAGVRAAELTNQLLAFSRKGKYEVRPVSLNNSVEDVLKLMGRTLDKSIEIATELQEKLPSVEGDPGQLEQAIINLCVNAAEAMPGGGKLQLETRVVALGEEFARKYLGSDPGDYVLLSVSDTGIGMDSETLSRMFEPFFTTKEMGKGTGLGLSTVYGIVKNHGGYVDVRSQPGKGSTFDIYLPVSKKQFTPSRPQAAELQTGHETILAVDDEEIIRSLLEETLKKLGYKVILANDGEEAVQIYEERKDEIDAVIIDMIMPHLGGRETFREIKMRNPDVRVLLVSGFSQDGAAQRILDEGVRGFIQKPFELVELSQKLRQILD